MSIPSTIKTTTASLAFVGSAYGHSWVEYAQNIDTNGNMVGALGYARGWVPRTTPGWGDKIPQWLLPLSGQSSYSGNEILNKYPFQENPSQPMLQSSPGGHVALWHMENGHTTLPQNQPKKPHNRGTIFIYGTSDPKPQEKLFDVHLLWNRDGTGGDKRGVLLATRNYDDGNCYQPNNGVISTDRAKKLAPDGAKHDEELICQSDIQLPSDLKTGSVYTIYWYWDWPDLNADKMNVTATINGIYPWAGTFMRGQKDPHGFTMDAIARNESYASTVDIKIQAAAPAGSLKAAVGDTGAPEKVNIYSMAIPGQMKSNFQVDIDANGAVPADSKQPAGSTPVSSTPAGEAPGSLSVITMTKTVTVAPPAVTKTATVYGPPPASSFVATLTPPGPSGMVTLVSSSPGAQGTDECNEPMSTTPPTTTTRPSLPAGTGGVYFAPVASEYRRRGRVVKAWQWRK